MPQLVAGHRKCIEDTPIGIGVEHHVCFLGCGEGASTRAEIEPRHAQRDAPEFGFAKAIPAGLVRADEKL